LQISLADLTCIPMQNFVISQGFEERHRRRAAQLYLEAFGPKLGRILGTGPRVEALFADILGPEFALCAIRDGELFGIAGYKTAQGGLTKGSFRDMKTHYGAFGGLWRGLALSVLEREVAPDRLLMDGIAVAAEARGLGLGTALLEAIIKHARVLGLAELRLDVIDSNPRARALYERMEFVAGDVQHMGLLKHVFGFSNATTMIRQT